MTPLECALTKTAPRKPYRMRSSKKKWGGGRSVPTCTLQVLEMRQAEGGAQVLAQLDPMPFRDGHKHLDDFRIELAAGAALNFLARVRHRQRPAIRPVADHGIERVSNGENARSHRNLIASQPPRVARAVIKLLMREDDFCGIAEERDANQHVVADFAVRAHDFLFVVVERTGLSQNAVRNGHLADIVEKR